MSVSMYIRVSNLDLCTAVGL